MSLVLLQLASGVAQSVVFPVFVLSTVSHAKRTVPHAQATVKRATIASTDATTIVNG